MVFGCMAAATTAQDTSLYQAKLFLRGSDTLRYRIMYAAGAQAGKKYPVILFLHGAGERGSDNSNQLLWGSSLFTDSVNRSRYPAIIIFPQCPQNDFWARVSRSGNDSLGGFKFSSDGPAGRALQLVMELMDSIATGTAVNTKKIYVAGLSMGGMGTFEILWRKPRFFAAAVPICGGGDPAKVSVYGKKFPMWIFHGGSDPVVRPANSRVMLRALQKARAKVRYTEYPGVGHDSWKNAFAEPTLLAWLFQQKR